MHISDINTRTLAVKAFREMFGQIVIVLLLGCYFHQTRPLLGRVGIWEVLIICAS